MINSDIKINGGEVEKVLYQESYIFGQVTAALLYLVSLYVRGVDFRTENAFGSVFLKRYFQKWHIIIRWYQHYTLLAAMMFKGQKWGHCIVCVHAFAHSAFIQSLPYACWAQLPVTFSFPKILRWWALDKSLVIHPYICWHLFLCCLHKVTSYSLISESVSQVT